MQLERGDIGVLYGNLLDNAIEACRKVPEEKRFIWLENKYQSGKLLLVITNSKTMEKNENLKTTKKDSYSHGRGILSVQRVADKYNGTAGFTDKGEVIDTVKSIENGRRAISLDTYLNIVQALETSPLALMSREQPEQYIERFIFMMNRCNEREIEFALHMVEQLLKGQDNYLSNSVMPHYYISFDSFSAR